MNLVLPLGAALLAALVVVLLVVAARRAGPDGAVPAGGAAARARRLLQGLGAAVGLCAAALVVQTGTLGRGLLLAAPVAALGLLLGVLAGELAVRPPTGPVRTASLATRRAADHLPRRLTPAVSAAGAALVALVTTTTLAASPDDLGRPGRWLVHACSAAQTAARGPFPGSFYTAPLVVLVLLGAGLALLVLRATVSRPPLRAEGVDPAVARALDDRLRSASARSVVAGLGVLVSLPLAGVAATAGSAVAGLAGCAPGWWAWAGAALGLLALAAAALLLVCVAVLLAGGTAPPTVPAATAAGRTRTGG